MPFSELMVRLIAVIFILLHILSPILPVSQAWGVSFFTHASPILFFILGILCFILALPFARTGF